MKRTKKRTSSSAPRKRALGRGGSARNQVRPVASVPAPVDTSLGDRARADWELGNWPALAALEMDALLAHPERARLALFVAAGHHQLGDAAKVREWVGSALAWKCPKQRVAEMLIAGVHNALGRASILLHDERRAASHFEAAVTLTGEAPPQTLAPARRMREVERLGNLSPKQGTTCES